MPRKVQTAQRPYTLLVANLRSGSDPSRNSGGNPVKIRTGFVFQHFPEVNRDSANDRGPSVERPSTPGIGTMMGRVDYTVPPIPVATSATVVVSDTDFSAPATLHLGDGSLVSDEAFLASSASSITGEDITSTPPDGVIVIWKTAGAGPGEGTIQVPNYVPVTASSVTIRWTSGGLPKSQTDDGVGGFAGADGNAAGSSIVYATGAIILDTTGDIPDAATLITIDYDPVVSATTIAASLAQAIDGLAGFSAAAVGDTVTVTGPAGPNGNAILFEAIYSGDVQNFTLSPTSGHLSGGEPTIGPPEILT